MEPDNESYGWITDYEAALTPMDEKLRLDVIAKSRESIIERRFPCIRELRMTGKYRPLKLH
jgi:hypothetical protein